MKKNLVMCTTALAVLTSGSAFADALNSTATLTVLNAISITEDSPLDYGTLQAVHDDANDETAALTMNADGVTATPAPTISGGTIASLQELIPGSPAAFTVSGLPAYASMTVDVNAGAATTLGTGAPSTATFELDTWTGYITTGSAPNTTFDPDTGEAIAADASGVLSFNIAATLTTDDSGNDYAAYTDAAYTGTFTVNVNY